MLYVFAIIFFTVFNARICKRKGRKPGGIIALTIILCVVFIMAASTWMVSRYLPELGYDLSSLTPETAQELEQNLPVIAEEMANHYGTQMVLTVYLGLLIGGLIPLFVALRMKPGPVAEDVTGQGTENPYAQPGGPDMTHYYQPGRNGEAGKQGTPESHAPMGSVDGLTPEGTGANDMTGNVTGDIAAAGPATAAAGASASAAAAYSDDDNLLVNPPCNIWIVREASEIGEDEIYTFSVNGQQICHLANDSQIVCMTSMKQNTVTGRRGDGSSLHKPVSFKAKGGAMVELHVCGDSFVPEKTVGHLPKKDQ